MGSADQNNRFASLFGTSNEDKGLGAEIHKNEIWNVGGARLSAGLPAFR